MSYLKGKNQFPEKMSAGYYSAACCEYCCRKLRNKKNRKFSRLPRQYKMTLRNHRS